MNPTLVRDIEGSLERPSPPARQVYEGPLSVAAGMLSRAPRHQMTSTTVVVVLGGDDVDAFRARVSEIGEEFGLGAAVRLQIGSYSVRFRRLD